jgi:hypothetical protein
MLSDLRRSGDWRCCFPRDPSLIRCASPCLLQEAMEACRLSNVVAFVIQKHQGRIDEVRAQRVLAVAGAPLDDRRMRWMRP